MNKKGKIETVLLVWMAVLITIVSFVYLYNYYHSKERKERVLEKEMDTLFNQVPEPGISSEEMDRRVMNWYDKKQELEELKGGR